MLVDAWLAELVHAAVDGDALRGVALVAVGGYGRSELCPNSDIDVVLLHEDFDDIAAVADRIWYPLWDAGFSLGHSVRTVRQTLHLASADLDTATSLLSVRHIGGDDSLSIDLSARAMEQWQKGAKRWLARLGHRVSD